jgi:hypothetical protein
MHSIAVAHNKSPGWSEPVTRVCIAADPGQSTRDRKRNKERAHGWDRVLAQTLTHALSGSRSDPVSNKHTTRQRRARVGSRVRNARVTHTNGAPPRVAAVRPMHTRRQAQTPRLHAPRTMRVRFPTYPSTIPPAIRNRLSNLGGTSVSSRFSAAAAPLYAPASDSCCPGCETRRLSGSAVAAIFVSPPLDVERTPIREVCRNPRAK